MRLIFAFLHTSRTCRARVAWLGIVTLVLTISACGPVTPSPPAPVTTPIPTQTRTTTPNPSPTVTLSRTASPTPTATPRPSVQNPLTGLPVQPSVLQRRPLLVRIGNDPEARPQTGLAKADVVFEDIMEGRVVTRLTAVYYGQDPNTVRPVRSARLVNLELGDMFDGALAYSGASDPVRYLLSKVDFVTLDEFFHPHPYTYGPGDWRTRLYTTGSRLREYMKQKGWEGPVKLKAWTFSAPGESPPNGRPAAQIQIPYPPKSATLWRYEPGTGRYLRFVEGRPHTDAEDGRQLSAANVIVVYARHENTDIVEDSLGSRSIRIVLQGSGKAQLLRDGVLLEGTWQRPDDGLIQFTAANGRPLQLKPGNTWIEIVPDRNF